LGCYADSRIIFLNLRRKPLRLFYIPVIRSS